MFLIALLCVYYQPEWMGVRAQAADSANEFDSALESVESGINSNQSNTYVTPMTLIPKGATLNTFPGYSLEGSYATVVTVRGTLDLEILLSLEAPTFLVGSMYQTWH